MFHSKLTYGSIHIAMNWTFADAATRLAFTLTADDIHKFAYQEDNSSVWMSVAIPNVWIEITNVGALSAKDVSIPIRKASPGTVIKGQAVYASGWDVVNQAILVELAKADSMATMPVVGIVRDAATDTVNGAAVIAGQLEGFDTSHLNDAWHFHADPVVAGGLTSAEVPGPNVYQILGECIYSDAVDGMVKVFIESFKHLSNADPQDLGVKTSGTSPYISRRDHVHAHGDQAGGTLHADATPSVAGFMSGQDKTDLDLLVDQKFLTVRKASAGTIPKGAPVYLISWNIGGWHEVESADADDAAKMPCIGLAYEPITNAADARVLTAGELNDIDTSTYALQDGLYVSTTAGQLTNVRPTGPTSAIQRVATVTRVDASEGRIIVVGAGRTNATPNLTQGYLWVGDANAYPQEQSLGSVSFGVKAGIVAVGSFAGTPKKATVTFATAYPDANYAVELTAITQNNKTFSLAYESKVAGSFVINAGTNNVADLLAVDWRTTLLGEA